MRCLCATMSTMEQDCVVLEKLQTGEYTRFKPKQRSNGSDVWDNFDRIRETATKRAINKAICKKCTQMFSYISNTSTSNLKKHSCFVLSSQAALEKDTTPEASTGQKIKIPPAMKEEIKTKSVEFVTSDLRSFEIVGSKFQFFNMLLFICIEIILR